MRISVSTTWAFTDAYNDRSTARLSAFSQPINTNGGWSKSRIDDPSRMNSGLEARRMSGVWPLAEICAQPLAPWA